MSEILTTILKAKESIIKMGPAATAVVLTADQIKLLESSFTGQTFEDKDFKFGLNEHGLVGGSIYGLPVSMGDEPRIYFADGTSTTLFV